jgi:bifunctional non-homologous end joining protein LigD
MLAYKAGQKVSLISRNGIDRSNRYPTIGAGVAKLNTKPLLLDGEIVAFDARRVSVFDFCSRARARCNRRVRLSVP